MGKFHDVLGVKPTATKAEIKKAFHKLSKQHHPDLNPGDKENEDKYKEISAAYNGLMNGDDGDDREAKAREYARKHFHDSGFMDAMHGMMREAFVMNQFSQVGESGANVRIDLNVPVKKMYEGGEIKFEGMIPTMTKTGFGYVPREKMIVLEKNTPVGTHFTFPGEGCRGADGTVGDLVIVVNPIVDGIFEVEGLNIIVRGKIPSTDAIVGKTKRFKLPSGELQEFNVPIGANNNSVLHIPGKGLKDINGRVGNLIIVFELFTPKFTDEQRVKIAELLDSFQTQ